MKLVELVGSDMDRSINLDRLEGKPGCRPHGGRQWHG